MTASQHDSNISESVMKNEFKCNCEGSFVIKKSTNNEMTIQCDECQKVGKFSFSNLFFRTNQKVEGTIYAEVFYGSGYVQNTIIKSEEDLVLELFVSKYPADFDAYLFNLGIPYLKTSAKKARLANSILIRYISNAQEIRGMSPKRITIAINSLETIELGRIYDVISTLTDRIPDLKVSIV